MNLEVTPIFTKNYHSDKFMTVNRGGSRSSKTRSLCQIALMWLISGRYSSTLPPIPKGVWTTVRKYATTLQSTVIRDFEEEIDKQGVWGNLQVNKTLKQYRCGERMVEFIGADDQQKLRGYKSNILYCNEANELGFKEEFFQLLIRTTDKIFIDFNPSDEFIWINTEIEQKRALEKGDVDVIISNYKDNTFLTSRQVEEIEYLQASDPEFWKIYGLGEYGKIFGTIYTHWKVVDEFPDKETFYGLDFGFNNPTALIECCEVDGAIYARELIYESKLTNADLISKLNGLDLGKKPIYADAEDPNRIEEIFRAGFNAKPADKGKDSVRAGIDKIKQRPLFIHRGSVNLIREMQTYKWETDKNGVIQDGKPVKFQDHACDSLRYAVFTHSKPSGWYGMR
jgi:phage terminase large subunit